MSLSIALVPYKVPVEPALLARVAAALDVQVRRDFGPRWGVDATVTAISEWQAVPPEHVRIILVDQLDSGALGVHASRQGQPYSLVALRGEWSIVASHECLEMLADPSGNRTIRGPSPIEGQGEVEFLIEICDPCQGKRWSYDIDGVAVSDFCTPGYYRGVAEADGRWSFRGALTAPHQVLRDGYVLWRVPERQIWWRRDWMGAKLADYELGPLAPTVSYLRGHVDRLWRTQHQRNRRTRQLALRRAAESIEAARELTTDIERELDVAAHRRAKAKAAPRVRRAAPGKPPKARRAAGAPGATASARRAGGDGGRARAKAGARAAAKAPAGATKKPSTAKAAAARAPRARRSAARSSP